MSILLLVVVLLVIAIVLSRLTWASQFGERRSIKHHEQAMDVLRSVAGRPEDAEAEADSAHSTSAHSAAHVRSTMEEGADFPAPAPSRAVPETASRREETIRILRPETPGQPRAEPFSAEPPLGQPPLSEPPRAEPAAPRPDAPWEPAASTARPPSAPPRPDELVRAEAAGEPASAETAHAGVESPPSWEPATAPRSQPNGDGEPVKPAFVFVDDSGRPGPVSVPTQVAEVVRGGDGAHWANGGDGNGHGDGHGDGQRGDGQRGDGGWGNGHGWDDDPTAVSSTLPRPPSIGDPQWAASSRSEARSRSRARTRSRLLGRVLAPFQATGRAASSARDRLGTRRAGAGVGAAAGVGTAEVTPDGGSDTRVTATVTEAPATEGVKLVTDDTVEVPTAPTGGADFTTGDRGEGIGATTAPVPEVAAASPRVDEGTPASDGISTAALDAAHATGQWAAKVSRRPRFGLAVGLTAIVVAACVVVGVLVASMSTSSNKAQQPVRHQSAPPAGTAPAPPPSPLRLVAQDNQGAWYNVNATRLSVQTQATGRVWLEIVAGTNPSGPVLFQGILTDGQSQTITNDAPVWMRIGASSNVTVTVNGSGVQLPQTPNTFNLAFTHG